MRGQRTCADALGERGRKKGNGLEVAIIEEEERKRRLGRSQVRGLEYL